MTSIWLILTIVIPLFGAAVQMLMRVLDFRSRTVAMWIGVGCSLVSGLIGVSGLLLASKGGMSFQYRELYDWLNPYSIHFDLLVDGVNAPLVLLISVVFPLILASYFYRKEQGAFFSTMVLLMQSASIGLVCSNDLFFVLVFWSFLPLPLYFLISILESGPGPEAGFRFLFFSFLGSAFFFAAVILIYFASRTGEFSISALLGGEEIRSGLTVFGYDVNVAVLAFVLLNAALFFRLPMFPLHGWFHRLVVNAPDSVNVLLMGVYIPAALYVYLRLGFSLFPKEIAHLSFLLTVYGVLTYLYASVCAVSQKSPRLFLSFCVMAQVSLFLVGVSTLHSAGVVGALLHLVAAALALTCAAFLFGVMGERFGSIQLGGVLDWADGGSVKKIGAPGTMIIGCIVLFALVGVPGTVLFVSQSLIMIGGLSVSAGVLAAVVVGSLIMLVAVFRVFKSLFIAKLVVADGESAELTRNEKIYLVPLVLIILALGLYPVFLVNLLRPSALTLLSIVK